MPNHNGMKLQFKPRHEINGTLLARISFSKKTGRPNNQDQSRHMPEKSREETLSLKITPTSI